MTDYRIKRIAELSLALCRGCPAPYACCIPLGCSLVEKGPGSLPADKPMPYLSTTGCTLPPERRPACSMFLCVSARNRLANILREGAVPSGHQGPSLEECKELRLLLSNSRYLIPKVEPGDLP